MNRLLPAFLRTRLSGKGFRLDPMVPMLLMATLVGFVSALVVSGFRQAMVWLIHLYSTQDHLVAAAQELPAWERVLIPFLAALIGGLIMWAGARWIRRPRGPEYMEAVRVGNGRLPLIPNLIRTLSSLLAVSGGITIGREGTMIQLAALVSSLLGRVRKMDVKQQRLIVACGAAAGFASAYHAPIAGALFVAEIILGALELNTIAAVLVAAVVGELTTKSLFSTGVLYLAQTIPTVSFMDLLRGSLLGLVAGVMGSGFLWLLDVSRRKYQSWLQFVPFRMALAGLLIGLLSVIRPEVWGNGYSTVQSFLTDHWVMTTLVEVTLLRLIAVAAASAAGIPGGVLTPTLLLGGATGLLMSHVFFFPDVTHSQTLWTLVGMGSLLAATTHAPAVSAIMMFEITNNYNVVMVAMPACVIASVIGRMLHRNSVYSESLGFKDNGVDSSNDKAQADA